MTQRRRLRPVRRPLDRRRVAFGLDRRYLGIAIDREDHDVAAVRIPAIVAPGSPLDV